MKAWCGMKSIEDEAHGVVSRSIVGESEHHCSTSSFITWLCENLVSIRHTYNLVQFSTMMQIWNNYWLVPGNDIITLAQNLPFVLLSYPRSYIQLIFGSGKLCHPDRSPLPPLSCPWGPLVLWSHTLLNKYCRDFYLVKAQDSSKAQT